MDNIKGPDSVGQSHSTVTPCQGRKTGVRGFLSSIGCINPATKLATATDDINFVDSRKRVIAIIDDMKAFLGASFPSSNGVKIPNTTIVIK